MNALSFKTYRNFLSLFFSFISINILLSISFSSCHANAKNSLYGLWKTGIPQLKILLNPCPNNSEFLCGTIVDINLGQNQINPQEIKDEFNPQESLRNRKIIGLISLEGFEKNPQNPFNWTQGTLYNIFEGKTYSCELTLVDSNTLKVHEYVGLPIFGRSEIWTRSTPHEKLEPINIE